MLKDTQLEGRPIRWASLAAPLHMNEMEVVTVVLRGETGTHCDCSLETALPSFQRGGAE